MQPIIGDTLQKEVLSFLGSAEAHGLSAPPKRIDTHSSVVFLAGQKVYKVKRAVKLPFLDYSTLEKRKFFCEREFSINRELAPYLYQNVVAIRRNAQGMHIGGAGEIVEWAVQLRRFDESQTLDRLTDAGDLAPQIIRDLATAVATAHSTAKVIRNANATNALEDVLHETLHELTQAPHIFPRQKMDDYGRAMRTTFREARGFLMIREAIGFVRRCHGDLHLRNVAIVDGKVTLFDAIEFDEAVATTDILYDLAFLLMDLWEKNLKNEANSLMNRYLWQAKDMIDDLHALSVLPLFLSLRAAIRAKIAALTVSKEPEDRHAATDARLYFEAARRFLKPHLPSLIAIGGRSGTGKSTLAAGLAPYIGRPPGAVHLRSDIERKRQFQVPETDRLANCAYKAEVSEVVPESRTAV